MCKMIEKQINAVFYTLLHHDLIDSTMASTTAVENETYGQKSQMQSSDYSRKLTSDRKEEDNQDPDKFRTYTASA